MRLFRFWLPVFCIVIAALFLIIPAEAGEYFATKEKVALRGYDVVSYFRLQKPVKGKKSISTIWRNITWLFENNENRTAFEANPEKYAPQFGGWCSYAASKGYTSTTVPDAFSIIDGKLYLNFSLGVHKEWLKNAKSYITEAEKKWPGLRKELTHE